MARARRVFGNDEFRDDSAADEVFLDNSFEHDRGTGMVPDCLRINHRNGALDTNAQAIRLGPVYLWIVSRQPQLLEPFLEVIPRRQPCGFGATFGL